MENPIMINVTKPFLPPLEEYLKYVTEIWERNQLTNYGPLVCELEEKLSTYLGVDNLFYCSNGTIALQAAIKALNIAGEVITTPFSYVATTNSIIWENCTPIFVDIREDDFCINHEEIESKITEKTTAIMAVHVYGFPCHVDEIDRIAQKHNLKVIYDGAHAFGAKLNNKSLLDYGDISTCSFHATKLFHTIEGGAVISNNKELAIKVRSLLTFGHSNDEYFEPGINGKNSEFHAAMGLCNFKHINIIISERKILSEYYDQFLQINKRIIKPKSKLSFEQNYSYYTIVFENENTLLKVKTDLNKKQIYPRRYFHPSLNTLPFIPPQNCHLSELTSKRVLCLPLFNGLTKLEIENIATTIRNSTI